MRLNNSYHHAQKLFRARATSALIGLALLSTLAAAGARAQQPSNSNAAGQQQPKRAKRITPLRASDSAQGSRVTITSDGELNDYSAYRSGDRFIVVIPQAQGGGGEGARGRGFEGAQVSRRGNDLVYTFKLQPGASAKVSQKFNRLDVQFTAAKGGEAAPSVAATPRAPAEIAGIRPQPAASPTPARAAPSPAALQPQLAPSPSVAANPGNVSPSFPAIGTTPAPTPSAAPSVAPSVLTAATPAQLAQAQATPAAPVNIISPSAAPAASTLGAFVQHNWHWLVGALLVVGVGLLLVTRLGDRQTSAEPPVKSTELRDARTTDESWTPAKPQPVAPAKPAEVIAAKPAVEVAPATMKAEVAEPKNVATLAAAIVQAGAQTKKQDKKKKRGKKGRAGDEPVAKVEASQPSADEAKKIPAAALDRSAPERAADSAGTAADVLTPAAIIAGAALAGSQREETKAIEVAGVPADSERVGEEIGKLFAGETYDESVVGAGDRATREMVSSELLAGLSSRNAERNTRARAAFLKHGYFEDATRDLQSAEAPAQRASAAHALSLLRDRTTTPHLVAALEDPSSDVRRASVEALAELRDPAALEPLEALRWRETSRQVPRALILRAIEACTPSAAETAETAAGTVAETEAAIEPTVEASALAAAGPEGAQIPEAAQAPGVVAGTEAATAEAAFTQSTAHDTEAPAADETSGGEDTLSDVTVETSATAAALAAATTAPAAEEEEFEMIAGVEVPRTREGAPATSGRGAGEFGETPVLEVPAAEPAVETAREQFDARDEATGEHAAPESVPFEAQRIESPAAPEVAAEVTAAAESPAFVEPRVEEVEVTESFVPAAPIESYAESAPAEASTPVDAADASAADFATDETVYAFGEREPAQAESFERAADEAAEETAEQTPVFSTPGFAIERGEAGADDWLDVDVNEQPAAPPAPPQRLASEPAAEFMPQAARTAQNFEPNAEPTPSEPARGFVSDVGEAGGTGVTLAQKGIELSGIEPEDVSIIPKAIQLRLGSEDASERAASVRALARLDTDEGFQQICASFDDPSQEVRDAAARALYDSAEDRAESFTRALRESPPERRRNIGASLASSGLAEEAVSQLTGESREKTYDAFSLLFLMAKAGETAPLIRAVEGHPENEVRLAVVKLLALSGQQEVLPSFKRLAVRGSLPNEVRSAVMEAIYQISSSASAQPQAPKPTRMA